MTIARRTQPPTRRQPQQQRAQLTVEAILDATAKILKYEGVDAVTTNRIAKVAGVSVGSVYQYFPDKRAIFLALHERHADEIGRLIERTVVENAGASIERMLRALIDALVDAHAPDPELYALLDAEIPHRAAGARSLQRRLRDALSLALGSRARAPKAPRDLERTLFVVAHLIDALTHGAVLDRPRGLSLASAKEETAQAALAYLRYAQRTASSAAKMRR